MIDFLYNPQGRISRKGYLVAFLVPWLFLTQVMPGMVAGSPLGIIFSLISIFYLWPSMVAVPVKRFHDMGLTGWFQAGILGLTFLAALMIVQGVMEIAGDRLESVQSIAEQQKLMLEVIQDSSRAQLGAFLALLVNLAQIVLFLAVKGQSGANKYGNDPLASGRGFAD